MSKKKRNIIIFGCIAAVIVILTACLLLVFLLKPKPASSVQVVATDHQILIKAPITEENRTYKFKFESNGEIKEFESESNLLDITNFLWDNSLQVGREYNISVCQIEPTGVLAGDYSQPISYTPSLKLERVNITYDETQNTISWQQVKGADFYNVCYNDGANTIKVKTQDLIFDLSELLGGERNVFVTAGSNNSFLIESDSSNAINAVIHHGLSEFISANLDENLIVTIISPERVIGILLSDGQSNFEITNFATTAFEDKFKISFSAKFIGENDVTLTVKPLADEFNSFSGQAIVVEM